jgi:hypothetical protein
MCYPNISVKEGLVMQSLKMIKLNVTFEIATGEDYINDTKAVASTIKIRLSKDQ